MVDAGHRAVIQAELEKLVAETLAGADNMKVYDSKPQQTVQLEWINGNPVMVNTVSVDGVFVEDYKKFTADYFANI